MVSCEQLSIAGTYRHENANSFPSHHHHRWSVAGLATDPAFDREVTSRKKNTSYNGSYGGKQEWKGYPSTAGVGRSLLEFALKGESIMKKHMERNWTDTKAVKRERKEQEQRASELHGKGYICSSIATLMKILESAVRVLLAK